MEGLKGRARSLHMQRPGRCDPGLGALSVLLKARPVRSGPHV
jgi:hypothetical protein